MSTTATPKQDAATIVTKFVETCDLVTFCNDLVHFGHTYGSSPSLRQMFKAAVEDELRNHYIAKCRCRPSMPCRKP
jgi:hypothetical protein